MSSRLTRQMLLASGLLAVVVAAAFGTLVASVDHLAGTDDLARHSEQTIAQADALERTVIDLETGQRGFLITHQERFLEPWQAGLREYPDQVRVLEGLVADNPAQASLARRIGAGIQSYVRDYSLSLVREAHHDLPGARAVVATGEGKRRVDALRGQFARFVAAEDRLGADRQAQAHGSADLALAVGIAGLGCSLALILLFGTWLARSIARPVRRVALAAGRVAAGHLEARVPAAGPGELRQLAEAFNAMASSLQDGRDELEHQHAELEAQHGELERTIEQLAAEKERVEGLRRLGELTAAQTALAPLADLLLRELADAAAAELGALYVAVTEDHTALPLAATRGLPATTLAAELTADAGLAGRALGERRVLVADHGTSGLRLATLGGERVARHELHLPVRHGERVLAVVSLARLGDDGFGEGEVEALLQLAERGGLALANVLSLERARLQAEINRDVVETALDAFVAADLQGTITAWSPQAEALFGWSAAEAVGQRADALLVPERHREAYRAGHLRLLAPGTARSSTRRFEVTARHRDGHELPVELSASPIWLGGDGVVNAFIRDIAGQRRAQRFERMQLAVSRALAESAGLDDAVGRVLAAFGEALGWDVGLFFAVDAEAETMRCTETWSAQDGAFAAFSAGILGMAFERGESLPGRGWERGAPLAVADVAVEHSPRTAALATEHGLHGAVALPILAGHEVLAVLVFCSGQPLRDQTDLDEALGSVTAQVGHFWQRKRAEREADRLKDEFFALVSHELRTPLTSIVGYLELVLEEEAGEVTEDQRQFLSTVERNARRLQRLVGDLLFVAQVEAGKLSLDEREVDLATLVGDAVEAARPRARAYAIELATDAVALRACAGDPDRLGQVLDNLITNALKFTPAGGRVDVRLSAREDRALIEVRDTGPGIPAGEQGRVFERFFRAQSATDQAIPGIGLGLTISRAIVEGHGGTIAVASEPGLGATFRVELPLTAVPGPGPGDLALASPTTPIPVQELTT